MNENKISKEGCDVVVKTYDTLCNNNNLCNVFNEWHFKDYSKHLEFYDKIYLFIIKATFHSKTKAVTKKFKERKVGCYAKESCDAGFWKSLQVVEESKCKRIAKKQKRTNYNIYHHHVNKF
jgi:hypothetical protein